MLDYIYNITDESLLTPYIQIQGNIKYANKIKELVKNNITQNKSLYQSQEEIKEVIIKDNGEDYYINNGNAINFIIENEYANLERKTNFIFDKKQEQDFKNGTLY